MHVLTNRKAICKYVQSSDTKFTKWPATLFNFPNALALALTLALALALALVLDARDAHTCKVQVHHVHHVHQVQV